jgi:hypothetical protein
MDEGEKTEHGRGEKRKIWSVGRMYWYTLDPHQRSHHSQSTSVSEKFCFFPQCIGFNAPSCAFQFCYNYACT